MNKKIAWLLLLALVLPMVLGACAAATPEPPPEVEVEEPSEPEPEPEEPAEPEEPMAPAVDPSGQTVQFWHVWGTDPTASALQAIVDEFNATNEWGITVEASEQGRYSDLEDAMNVAIQSGDVPNIVVGYTNALDTWYSVDVLGDMNPYIGDPDWGLTDEEISDFYSGVWNNGVNAEGARVGFPHGQSAETIFYNHTWAQELGFASPPTTFEELKDQACAAAAANAADADPDNDGTGGFVLYAGASQVASFVFAAGGDYISEDGQSYDFTSPEIQEVAEFFKEIWDEGCAFPVDGYPNPEFATRKALMVMSSTAGLPYQASAFEEEDAYGDDVWGMIPFPNGGDGIVDSYAQNSGIVLSNPEQELASWLFLKWFTSPEINAKWIEGSGYHPIRESTIDLLGDHIDENPLWAGGISLVPLGLSEPGWASYGTVRRDIQDTFAAILQGDVEDIPGLLEELNAAAADALAETQ
jgi:multiple sugar transport system substrate-binding protein